VFWEGPEAVEEVSDAEPTSLEDEVPKTPPKEEDPLEVVEPEVEAPSESDDDPSSEDDYVVDHAKAKGKGVPLRKVSQYLGIKCHV
jgi:hypothetical protein